MEDRMANLTNVNCSREGGFLRIVALKLAGREWGWMAPGVAIVDLL